MRCLAKTQENPETIQVTSLIYGVLGKSYLFAPGSDLNFYALCRTNYFSVLGHQKSARLFYSYLYFL